jgi:hypothetical protein
MPLFLEVTRLLGIIQRWRRKIIQAKQHGH